jgi:NAD(P)H-flavin reductase
MSMATMPSPPAGADMALDPMVPQVARVRRRRREAPNVWTLEIEPEGSGAAAPSPGQFNMLTAFGVGEAPVSLSGDPAQPGRLIHTIRAVGAVSRALVRLAPGEAVGLRGPFGSGWPMADAAGRDVVVIAGGLGLAPLRPALYRLLAERERYGRLTVLYGTRHPVDILFRRELEAWRRRLDVEIEVTVDHAASDWRGHVGLVTDLLRSAAFDPARTIALVCGPEIMMRFSIAALRNAGVENEAIHLSMERNMKCAIGLCGHCQLAGVLVCRDGPVFRHDRVAAMLRHKEI